MKREKAICNREIKNGVKHCNQIRQKVIVADVIAPIFGYQSVPIQTLAINSNFSINEVGQSKRYWLHCPLAINHRRRGSLRFFSNPNIDCSPPLYYYQQLSPDIHKAL